MDTRKEQEEPERREGLGGRVRRFIDTELSRVVNTEDPAPNLDDTDYRQKRDRPVEVDRTYQTDRAADLQRHKEPPTSSGAVPSRGGHLGRTTAPVDAGYDPPIGETGYDVPMEGTSRPATRSRTTTPPETRSREVPHRSTEEAAADGSTERVGLLNDPAALRDQWQQVQGTFVDDPQRAVHEASVLVERTLEEIHRNVTRGPAGDPTSTEDLRVSFQRYREFFQRLLSA